MRAGRSCWYRMEPAFSRWLCRIMSGDRLPEEKVEEVFRTLGDMPGNEERFITVYADIDVAYKITDYLDYEAANICAF